MPRITYIKPKDEMIMYCDKPIIILPEKISVLRDVKNQSIYTDFEQYSIYYKNIIYPYSEEYDVQIECEFGKNLGNCWRLEEFNDIADTFLLTLKIYGYYGKLLTEKSCRVQIFEKKEYPTVNLLCIGDSMTMAETYIAHTVNKLKNINTIGLRNISHNVNHEGRGGWTCSAYFEKYTDDGWGISPFLFPEGFDGKEYYGDKKFYEYMLNSNTDYSHIGTSVTPIQDGMVICDNDKLYRYSKGIYDVVCENPVFKFDFSKYMKDKTFLITGSNGMTGQAMVKWILYLNSRYQMNAKIFASTRNPKHIPDYMDGSENVVMCEFGKEEEAIGEEKVDYIIHAASPTERDFFLKYPVETYKVIVDGTAHMLELCEKKKASFILLSSVEVYGAYNSKEAIDEKKVGAVDSLNIRSGYPLGKKGAEFLTYSYCKEYGCNAKIVRISAIQGLYQPYNELRIYNEITRCIMENKNLIMKSDGKSKKSIIYTLDAVSGIFKILFEGEKGEVYNLTNPDTFLTVNEFAEKIFEKFNDKVHIEFDIGSESETGYLPHLEILQDTEKILKLGWKPITDLYRIYEIDLKRWNFSWGEK